MSNGRIRGDPRTEKEGRSEEKPMESLEMHSRRLDVDTASPLGWLDGNGTRRRATTTEHPPKEVDVDNSRRGKDGRDLRLFRRRNFD